MYLSYQEGDGHAGAEGNVPMISAVPSSDDMLGGVHALSIGSPGKAPHPPSARTAVQSPRASSQPRPKLIPALKPNPPNPQRWPLRYRHPTVTAGQAGNDVSLRPLWRWIPCRCRDGWGERGLGRGWDGCGSAVIGIQARKAQSGQGAETPAMPPTVKNDKWLGVCNALEGRWPCGCSAPLIA